MAEKYDLIQMGEQEEAVFVIGSPDMDVMFSDELPALATVKKYYEIPYDTYAIVMYHPVTTEYDRTALHVNRLVKALLKDTHNYIVIYPNNDLGSHLILDAYERLKKHPRFRLIPSMRFEYFLSLLKNAEFIVGNSSAGIREAPAYGVPCINIGSRQQNRASSSFICNVPEDSEQILTGISGTELIAVKPEYTFGKGSSAEKFLDLLSSPAFWVISRQKQFRDLDKI